MSELSEAIARAEARLEGMSEADRFKYHIIVLQDELRRGRSAQGIEAGTDETPVEAAQPEGQEPGGEAMRHDPVSTPQQHQER